MLVMWHIHNVQKERRQGVWVWEWRGMKGWVVLWLDGVDVSVIDWCQTLCHYQCQTHQPIPSMVSHSPVCFKAIMLLPLQSVCWCCCVVPLFAPCPIPVLFDKWLWEWCHCRATISLMLGHPQRCESCHTMHLSFFWTMAETVCLQEMFVVFAERMDSQKVRLLVWKSPTVASQICTQSAHGPQWAESWCAQWVRGCGWTGSSCSMLWVLPVLLQVHSPMVSHLGHVR